ncbi:MAG TPA: OsmC family protein [Terriglobales bacterium]|nr:OsmC family protein [Terriglobales bacterium]
MASAPTTASARWIDGQRFVTNGSAGHAVVMDSSRELNSAPGPMEMVLRSLCACSATDIVIVLNKTRQRYTHIEVSAEGARADEPPTVFTRIHMVYRATGIDLDRTAVERAVKLSREKYCSVFSMLEKTASMSFAIQLETAHL